MKNKIKDGLLSLFIGLTLTLTGMTMGLLMAMFQSKDAGIRYGFFKTVYFENRAQGDGSIAMTLGLTNAYRPLILSVILISGCVYLFFQVYKSLDERKKRLLEDV